jgi:hypothetical protein
MNNANDLIERKLNGGHNIPKASNLFLMNMARQTGIIKKGTPPTPIIDGVIEHRMFPFLWWG